MTIWKQIPGMPRYEASSTGEIRSWARSGPRSANPSTPRILSQTRHRSGHMRVCLGRSRSTAVHVLVLLAFHGPRPEGFVCRHLDGNPANNSAENLQWGTIAENCEDRRTHGTLLFGERATNARLTESDVRRIRQSSETSTEIAKQLGVNRTTIASIRKRKTWRHV